MCVEMKDCIEERARQERSVFIKKIIGKKGKMQPKSPEGAPDMLYYFQGADGAIPRENSRPIKALFYSTQGLAETGEDLGVPDSIGEHIMPICAFGAYIVLADGSIVEVEVPDWAEDYFHIYADGEVATPVPPIESGVAIPYIVKKQTERLKDTDWNKVLTPSYTFATNIYRKKEHEKHLLMYSAIDGGNMLPAKEVAIIGMDSLALTCKLNGLEEETGKKLIADETGYDVKQLCFVEQPYYHIDLAMMYLGKNASGKERIWLKQDNRGVSFTGIKEKLEEFGFEVVLDQEKIAGSDKGAVPDQKRDSLTMEWDYNFFNGEYLKIGKELYYITNGTNRADENKGMIREKAFEKKLQEYIPGIKVLFSKKATSDSLNKTHGGVGCFFKGGPSAAKEVFMS